MNNSSLIIDSNLSMAWARALAYVCKDSEPDCLTVAIRGFSGLPPQDNDIGDRLNALLTTNDPLIPTIAQTALTIIPYARWERLGRPPLSELREWYLQQFLPRLKARCSKNRHGTYFERLTSYTGAKRHKKSLEIREVDQLAHVLGLWKKESGPRPRKSALQLACFDPAKDHTGAALAGFPCLQQISLTYDAAGTLGLVAYYPTQYLFDRAYGNYLGLCQLGSVIAHELGLSFTRFTCFVANPQLGQVSKAKLEPILSLLNAKRPANLELSSKL